MEIRDAPGYGGRNRLHVRRAGDPLLDGGFPVAKLRVGQEEPDDFVFAGPELIRREGALKLLGQRRDPAPRLAQNLRGAGDSALQCRFGEEDPGQDSCNRLHESLKAAGSNESLPALSRLRAAQRRLRDESPTPTRCPGVTPERHKAGLERSAAESIVACVWIAEPFRILSRQSRRRP